MADEEMQVEPEMLETAGSDDLALEPLPDALDPQLWDAAVSGLREATEGYRYDGERPEEGQGHRSGMPRARDLVLPGDDPRDAELVEQPLSEDQLLRGRIFDVNRMAVRLPDGNEALRDIVRHPGAVAIVALTNDGRICLVRQYRAALGRVTLEIPAGKLSPGEDPLACARRELTEETGMVAENLAFLTTIATSVGFADELIHIYMATGLSFAQSDPDADEFINVDVVELSQLIDAVLDGRIEDAKTVVGALACDAIAHRLSADASEQA